MSKVVAWAEMPPMHETAPGGVVAGQTLSQSSVAGTADWTEVWAFRSSWKRPTSWTAYAGTTTVMSRQSVVSNARVGRFGDRRRTLDMDTPFLLLWLRGRVETRATTRADPAPPPDHRDWPLNTSTEMAKVRRNAFDYLFLT